MKLSFPHDPGGTIFDTRHANELKRVNEPADASSAPCQRRTRRIVKPCDDFARALTTCEETRRLRTDPRCAAAGRTVPNRSAREEVGKPDVRSSGDSTPALGGPPSVCGDVRAEESTGDRAECGEPTSGACIPAACVREPRGSVTIIGPLAGERGE
ncbi:hypothetical protein F2P81_000811 [Scophthalmus maximus]|uniref:Uncharacterized protein n=1 Tax=Scophthalmus maximus TaxID=52904 RepID=A0A6A4TS23_SCOMX|nr:hypothetical protein F2P81_000811 [Scophthalmus maximus]